VAKLGETSGLAREAQAALEEGKLEAASALLFKGYYNLGNTYRKENNYDMAIINYEQAIESASLTQTRDHFGAHYNLADSYRNIGDVERAIQHYQKAIEIRPTNSRANYNLANMYRQNGEYDLARKYYLRVIELEPEGSDLRNRAQENQRLLER
jgi:tetratricopeptide (TPR) repeat protein